MVLYYIIGALIIVVAVLLILLIHKINVIKEFNNELTKQARLDIEKQRLKLVSDINDLLKELKRLQEQTDQLLKDKNIIVQQQEDIVKLEVDKWASKYKEEQTKPINEEIQTKREELAAIMDEWSGWQKFVSEEKARLQSEIDVLKAAQDAANQEILRRKQVEEQQDFYRVVLPQNDKEDIEVLEEVRPRLHRVDNFDKLIYDNYLSKPVIEMVKRVLQGGAPSGIYKITRLKTGEMYVGKSTNVHDRWIQHLKTAMHCGTIAHSILHTTMEKDGVDNFTFELLEEVPKDKLTEREKFWINYYDTKSYGMNEREG